MTRVKSYFSNSLIAVLIVLCVTACTTNNGDIGDLYGRWQLESADIDGTPLTDWTEDGNVFCTWSLQNNIVEIEHSDLKHNNFSSFGTWVREGESMTFDFNHSDNDSPAGSGVYQAPVWIKFPEGTSRFDIVVGNGKRMVLTTILSDGRRLTYSLKKVM